MHIVSKVVDNKKIHIIDGAIGKKSILSFFKMIKKLPFRKVELDSDKDEYPIFSVDFETKKFEETTEIGTQAKELLIDFGLKNYRLVRAYVNMSHFGDMEFPHRDCSIQSDDITVLYYANEAWEYSWGGETKFYENKDTVLSILPKPGRIVIFYGAIEHTGSIPTRVCKVSRLTVAMKYTKKKTK